jgi:hypothetical protein
MILRAEYILIIDKVTNRASYDLCDRADELKRLIKKSDNFDIQDQKLVYENSASCLIEVRGGQVKGKEQRFFLVEIIFDGEEEQIDEFAKISRALRQVFVDAGGQIETLRNDISAFYAAKCYPLIHNLENLMRKLLNYFMVTQVGKEWHAEASPKDVKDAISKSNRHEYGDALYELDFIDLGDLLFKAYQSKPISSLYEVIGTAEKPEDLSVETLKDFIPKSNWERYFSSVVECTDEYLKKRWDELYKLRCKVAHNAIVNKSDYEGIFSLTAEVADKLENAVANIGSIDVPDQDKELLAENLVSNANALSGEFIARWREFEQRLRAFTDESELQLIGRSGGGLKVTPGKSVPAILRGLLNDGEINEETYNLAVNLTNVRNSIVHGAGLVDESLLMHAILTIRELIEMFDASQDIVPWKDEVVNAIRGVGGEAHMIDIYNYIEQHTKRELPQSWKASVRKTLQSYCSSMKQYLGGEDLFVHVDTGRWGLREYGR